MRIAFPEKLDATLVRDFWMLPSGSTHPHAGVIGGQEFVLKCGSYSTTSHDDHVHNECVGDDFLRAAGCNVPASREYRADIGHGKVETIRLAERLQNMRHLKESWQAADAARRDFLLRQIIDTYPVQSFIAGIDTYQHEALDNVMVDADGRLWFIDNGASFDYRAKGSPKGWFWDRTDLLGTHGYFSLRTDDGTVPCTYDQSELRALFADVSDETLRRAAAKYDFSALVKTLPADYQRPSLVAYAAALDRWSREG